MTKQERLYGQYQKMSENLNKWNERMKSAKTERTRKKYENMIVAAERKMRSVANRRIRSLRENDLFIDHGVIERRIKQGRKYLTSPSDVFNQAKAEAKFLSNEMSTKGGAIAALAKIRQNFEDLGYSFKSDQEFRDFFVWRHENGVSEFFDLYPPSPVEMRTQVSAMAIDLYNYNEKTRQILSDYFAEFQRYLETKDSDWTEGIRLGTLVNRIEKLYETEIKRRR